MGDPEVKVKIGLEIHGYLSLESRRKLFCNCLIDQDAEPNTTICPRCTGQPGSKPMLPNREAIEKIIAIGLLFGCTINASMLFQRKHYSWPDLPNGYQKTMSGSYGLPSAEHGSFFGIRISEVHLEEDPARWNPDTGEVDYNRSGYPLMELVTEPDFTSAEEVHDWLKAFVSALSYVKALNPALGIKCDVNVSISPHYIRTEVKNLNSLKSIKEAIAYEIYRQQHEEQRQQTRAYDPDTKKTVFMREKEEAADYLYIPEPDLVPIEIGQDMIEAIRKGLPESPEKKLSRYISQGLDTTDATVIARNLEIAELFDYTCSAISSATQVGQGSAMIKPSTISRWFRRDIASIAESGEKGISTLREYKDQLAVLLRMSAERKITDMTAKEILKMLSWEFVDVGAHVKKHSLEVVSDESAFENALESAIASSPDAVQDFLKGKDKAINAIVGKVMQQTRGRMPADAVKEKAISKINSSKKEGAR